MKSTQDEVEKFLDELDDGSKIYLNDEILRTKKGGRFEGVGPDGTSITPEDATRFSLIIFNNQHSLDKFEVYNSKNEKVAVDGLAMAVIDDAVAGLTAAGSAISPEKDALAKWQKEVSARPLQLGSKGPNVGILQDLLDNALNSIADDTSIRLRPDAVSAVRAQFDPLVKPGKDGSRPSSPARGPRISIEPGAKYDTVSDIAGALAFSLSRDNDFGPVTRVSVYVFQQFKNLQPDGRVGRDTAASLMKYAKSS